MIESWRVSRTHAPSIPESTCLSCQFCPKRRETIIIKTLTLKGTGNRSIDLRVIKAVPFLFIYRIFFRSIFSPLSSSHPRQSRLDDVHTAWFVRTGAGREGQEGIKRRRIEAPAVGNRVRAQSETCVACPNDEGNNHTATSRTKVVDNTVQLCRSIFILIISYFSFSW